MGVLWLIYGVLDGLLYFDHPVKQPAICSISTKDCKKTQNIVAFKCARIQDIFLNVLTKARISPLAAQSLSCRGASLA